MVLFGIDNRHPRGAPSTCHLGGGVGVGDRSQGDLILRVV